MNARDNEKWVELSKRPFQINCSQQVVRSSLKASGHPLRYRYAQLYTLQLPFETQPRCSISNKYVEKEKKPTARQIARQSATLL